VKAVVFVPSAPFLLLGAGPADLRAAIDEALNVLVGDVVVVGAAPTPGWQEGSVDLTPYGVRGEPAEDPLALALAVGRTLLGARPHRLWGVPSDDRPDADSLLVVADGTTKRTEKAPGHFDPRAEGYDRAVEQSLAAGRFDVPAVEDLGVAGLPAWELAGRLPGPWRGRVGYAGAPYGVGYLVATWLR
jgi:hypothetical protein